MTTDKYAQDGVNVGEGDSFSEFAGNLCKQTYRNSPYIEVRDFSRGHFRGPRAFRLKNLPDDCWMDTAPDGDGTKVVLVDAAGDYEHASNGWVAMTGGDITRWGGIPLVFVNNFDLNSLGEYGNPINQACRTMIAGLKQIADRQRFVMYKGETAELGECVGSENSSALVKYLWSGVAVGAYREKTIITGDQVKEGMVVIALREKGFRNNGISSVRKAIRLAFGSDCYSNPEAKETIRKAATPTVLYDLFLTTVNGWYAEDFQPIVPVHLIVHVTGGAIKSKLAKDILFPRGLSAHLDNLWGPPDIMRQCAEWRGLNDQEFYEIWNGGQGVLVVVEDNDRHVADFFELAKTHGIEARVAGKITKEPSPVVIIESKLNGETIKFTT
ncbi:MAG: AIR synthase-related protein [Candidatus Moraniibacteriota bacterium]